MLTNVIAYLHTTFAYQSAAMQLMVGQANFDAQQLHLDETLPITAPANTNEWRLAMPPDGVTGTLMTSNYIYRFNAGKLTSIQRKPQARETATAASAGTSLVNTNDAYQLARQYLAAISVDVPALEGKYPHSVTALTARPSARHRVGMTNNIASRTAGPVFRIVWGGGHGRNASVQATMEILGATRQCLNLRIENPELLKTPPLQVTNAAALLGTPSPQHFVEELLGGAVAYGTVAKPDRVTASLLNNQAEASGSQNNSSPAVSVNAATAAALSRTLTDFNSYSWLGDRGCAADYTVRLVFAKGADNVEILWSGECDHVQITHAGRSTEKDCDPARGALIRAIKSIFPASQEIKN